MHERNDTPWLIIRFNTAFGTICFVLAAIYMLTYFQSENLPDPNQINQKLLQQPIQTETTKAPFTQIYTDKEYMIHPRFEYEFFGLIVSHKNLDEKWFNIYYDRDPFNIKDICAIWGSNLLRSDYQRMSYYNRTWTCYFKPNDHNVQFNNVELSNNHMIPATEDIGYKLKLARPGDQIHFKGFLVNYSIIGDGGGERKTSINRTDTGNGACEVVYVEEFEILKPSNSWSRLLNTVSFQTILLLILIRVYVFFAY